jgi:methylmalonyl-CoA/ethylmalonyl-CoA epimerase
MVRCLVFFFALLLVAEGGFAQLPELYRSVDRVTWVVKDLKPVIAGWEKMDAAVEDYGILEHKAVFRGRPVEVRVRAAGARIGNLLVDWVQPLGGENAYTEFLAKHGDGVFALVHRAPGVEAVEAEVARMRSRGVAVLQRGSIDTEDGSIAYVQFDTEPQGKYSLGLISVPPFLDEELPETAGLSQVTQFAFVARDIHAVSAYWQKLGFPAMDFTHPALTNRAYRGQPGRFDQELGWQRQGKVVYEWIQPLAGPTVYEDGLKAHGEGINHIAFDTGDMEKTIAQWGAAGYGIAQSGNWGETGKAGSGRFAYVDTNPVGGVLVELLWNYRP